MTYVEAGEVAVGDILFLPEDGWYSRTREEPPLDCLTDHFYLVVDVFWSGQAKSGLDRVWVSVVRRPQQRRGSTARY